MYIITKKVKLIPPVRPVIPSGNGTFLIIDAIESQAFGIGGAVLAEGSNCVTIDWGDGTRQTLTENIENLEHTYSRPGYYLVSVSDDLATFGVGSSDDERYATQFTRMVLEVVSRGQLDRIRSKGFMGAVNLKNIDFLGTRLSVLLDNAFTGCVGLKSVSGLPTTVCRLLKSCFCNCTSLAGRVDFPGVSQLVASGSVERLPFLGCDSIAEIHFAAVNEEEIKNTSAWAVDPKLGAANATVIFDL